MSFFFKALPSNQNRGGPAYNDPAPPAMTVPCWTFSNSTSRKKRPQTKKTPVPRKPRKALGEKAVARKKPARKPKTKQPSPSPSSSSSSSSSSSPNPEPRSLSASKSPAPQKKATAKRTISSSSFSTESDSDPKEEKEEEEEEEEELGPEMLSLEIALAESNQIYSLLAASHLLHQKLQPILHTALQQWETYLDTLTPLPTYSTLTFTDITPRAKKAALLYLVETMPARHRNMVAAYNDEKVEALILGERVERLREGLRMIEEGEGGDEMKLGVYYNHMLFKGVKLREEALMADKEIRALEEARLEELKELMGMYEELSILEGEGSLGLDEVQLLVDAMDDASAGSEASKEGKEISLD